MRGVAFSILTFASAVGLHIKNARGEKPTDIQQVSLAAFFIATIVCIIMGV